jgi:hypothetical protein
MLQVPTAGAEVMMVTTIPYVEGWWLSLVSVLRDNLAELQVSD